MSAKETLEKLLDRLKSVTFEDPTSEDVCQIMELQSEYNKTPAKYVWLNLETGQFSNTWGQEDHDTCDPVGDMSEEQSKIWKCVEYTCLNDEKFEFMNQMKLR